jgi:hypothetical protein
MAGDGLLVFDDLVQQLLLFVQLIYIVMRITELMDEKFSISLSSLSASQPQRMEHFHRSVKYLRRPLLVRTRLWLQGELLPPLNSSICNSDIW